MIFRMSVSKYAVAHPSQYFEESREHACIYTYTHIRTPESLADVAAPRAAELGHVSCFVAQSIFGPSDVRFPPSCR